MKMLDIEVALVLFSDGYWKAYGRDGLSPEDAATSNMPQTKGERGKLYVLKAQVPDPRPDLEAIAATATEVGPA